MDDQNKEAPKEITPRFGRLLIVCALSVIFCGALVYFMSDMFASCCDLSWLERLNH